MDSFLDLNNIYFNGFKVNIVFDDNNEPWFKLNDVVKVLKYKQIQNVYKYILSPKKKTLEELNSSDNKTLTDKKKKSSFYINITGLYSLIKFSKKINKFTKWLNNLNYFNICKFIFLIIEIMGIILFCFF